MQDLERMAIFARVVEAKSFSRAAKELGLSKSLVSKQITELEKSVGARLLNRTTRALSLTDAGGVFCDYCMRIIEERDQARLAVSHLQSEPRGLLRVSSSVAFGRLHVAPALAEFLARYRLHGPEGSISIQVPGNLRLNDDDALAEAVLSGVGIALLPTFIVGKEIQQGRLRSVMTEYVPLERSIYAVYLPTHHVPAKVRSFIDYLLERFGPEPYWDHVP